MRLRSNELGNAAETGNHYYGQATEDGGALMPEVSASKYVLVVLLGAATSRLWNHIGQDSVRKHEAIGDNGRPEPGVDLSLSSLSILPEVMPELWEVDQWR